MLEFGYQEKVVVERVLFGHWSVLRLQMEVGVIVVVGELKVVLLGLEVEGCLVEHAVRQGCLGVQLEVDVLCMIGWDVENVLFLDWLIC